MCTPEESESAPRRERITREEWEAYHERTRENAPRPLLVEAFQYVTEGREALDVGAGALNDSVYLLENGFTVTALDHVEVKDTRISDTLAPRFRYVISPMETFQYPKEAYDLVTAQYSLPFIHPPELFHGVLRDIIASLRPGGIFTGEFFGKQHDAGGVQPLTLFDLSEAHALLQGLEIIKLEPLREKKERVDGRVDDIIEFIVRKPVDGMPFSRT